MFIFNKYIDMNSIFKNIKELYMYKSNTQVIEQSSWESFGNQSKHIKIKMYYIYELKLN